MCFKTVIIKKVKELTLFIKQIQEIMPFVAIIILLYKYSYWFPTTVNIDHPSNSFY